ncbi:hypothetical protein KP509_17G009200 [Ceratopteris richardii]|uniref:Thioredoxin domain-containing protein n=1 Tax=Ceratopteris richardii TaxID=49495 RepID=A0A8T2SSQ5_CERRI|nr:hypothetical protein KP509_17G009200 [Ceratopteris richardii]
MLGLTMELAVEVVRMLAEPYYALHALSFLSYFIARHAATMASSAIFLQHLIYREIQSVLCLAVVLCLKFRKSQSIEALLADGLLYTKGVFVLLAMLLDRRLAAWYLLWFAVLFLLFQQPPYKGIGNVVCMTPLQLENHLSEGTASRCWLIEFRAVWSPPCTKASRIFVNLSTRYSSEDLYFGSVDIGRFPKAAELYGISLGVNQGELPTYILFEGGNEVSRLPISNDDGTKRGIGVLTEMSIAQHFELDRRLIFDLESKQTKK